MLRYNSAPHNENLTRHIFKSSDSYDGAISQLECILKLSPEPRIYQYSINKRQEEINQKLRQNERKTNKATGNNGNRKRI